MLDEVNRKLWANQEPDQKDKNPLEIIALCSFYSENFGQGEEHRDNHGQVKFLDTWVSSLLAMDELHKHKREQVPLATEIRKNQSMS